MAVDIKVAPDEKLELVQTYITDTNLNSDYFNISELPDTFSGGKNAFLIAGSDKLLANTEIKIQIRDAAGNVCYVEYSNGSPEYYEGNSKVAAVYVYPTITSFGPATITILGQLKDVPQEWNGLYSVKWTKQVNINPALANTTRVRFYKRPLVSITEIVEPLYTIVSGSKTASLIQGSFASIKVNQLETFAGDVKRIKVYRTAQGDISDYDLIQDILVESKNLLTTYELSGSVVGDGGLFTNDSLSKLWLTGSLNAALDATYIENGLQLTGSGTLTYSASLNLLSSNTYELELDSFFTGSTADNLGIYLSYPTQSTLGQAYTSTTTIAILNGSTPTKKFGIQTFPFTIPFDYPTASLYLSQSIGKWHVGNIGLNVSQDTAFSPNEISFVTSMPTVLTNETFNFKFEFYDVNNNYVPVAVTQSAVFVGGTNFNTLQSGSLYTSASLTALSQSVSGTISTTSASLSSSISKSASETSASAANFIILVSGSLSSSINVVSGSNYTLSQSVNSISTSLNNRITQSTSSSLYEVYSASAFLDKFIFTDENGKLNQPPTASGTGLFLGSNYLGFYSSSATASTSGWKTYMDNQGDFYLTGSNAQFLAWSSQLGTLQVQGVINIQGGNAATTSSVETAALAAAASGSASAAAVSSSLAPNIFTDSTGKINRPPTVLVNSSQGLFLGSTNLGYYSGSDWKTYMADNGNFYLSGAGGDSLTWAGGVLTINGAINITGGNATTTTALNSATASLSASAFGAFTSASSYSGSLANTITTNSGSTSTSISASNAASLAYSASTAATTALLDGRIFTDANGRIVKAPTASVAGLFLGNDHLGFYDSGTWKTYMDNAGKFYLTGSVANGYSNYLVWDGAGGLTIAGNINIVGGTAATQITNAASSGSNALTYAQNNNATASVTYALTNANTASISAAAAAATYALTNANTASITAVDNKVFTSTTGLVNKTPSASTSGLYLGSTFLGYYNGSDWKTYMSNTGNFFLSGAGSDSLSWSSGVLAINGAITATTGYIGTSAAGFAINSSYIGNGKTTLTDANAGVYVGTNGIALGGSSTFKVTSAGALTATSATITGAITATSITADTAGTIAGWGIDGTRFHKTVSGVGTIEIKSSDNTISMYDPSDNLRLQINPSTTLPTFASPITTTTIDALAGITLDAGSGVTAYNMEGPGVAGSDTADSTAVSIVLSGALNEIYIEDIASRWYDIGSTVSDNLGYFFYRLSGGGNMWNIKYTMTGILSGPSGTFSTILGYAYGSWNDNPAFYEWYNGSIYTNPAVFSNLAAGTYTFKIRHDMSWGKIFGTAFLRWFPWANHPTGIDRIDSTGNANINITYGASTAYSVINAGGVVLYNGSRNIFKVSQPATTDDSFFQVTGKSQFNTSLYVKGALAADSKQFQITHPLNKDKWLYHSAIEGPGAYLIYKGTSELQNGLATASIDLLSNMTSGTFESLVRRSQFFVQNNSSWDLVRGNVNDGIVYIESNNTNSTASVDWMVIGERKDDSILNSVLYDKDGNYKPEKYKSSYFLEYVDYETSGSI